MPPSTPRVRCRQITAADLPGVCDLLTEGFPVRALDYWRDGLARLGPGRSLAGYPEYGYMLDAEGTPVGVLLQLFSRSDADPTPVRCNLSSWYVRPAFRGYAPFLVSAATKLRDVTYFNTSPAEHTLPILHAQGFRLYTEGQAITFPSLTPPWAGCEVREVTPGTTYPDLARLPELELLQAQAGFGCVSLVCQTAQGPQPFSFVRRRIERFPLAVAQLVYCRSTADFVQCAGPVGRFLLRRGMAGVICDAEESVDRLVGRRFQAKGRRYYKGPTPPRRNDLSFTEAVLFGP